MCLPIYFTGISNLPESSTLNGLRLEQSLNWPFPLNSPDVEQSERGMREQHGEKQRRRGGGQELENAVFYKL